MPLLPCTALRCNPHAVADLLRMRTRLQLLDRPQPQPSQASDNRFSVRRFPARARRCATSNCADTPTTTETG